MSDAERAQKLRELLEDARNLDITIHSDDEAQEYLDWCPRRYGAPPENYHAVTLGNDIYVRPQYADNLRILREELIHVQQQREGIGSVVDAEIQARELIIQFRDRWGITDSDVRDMMREIERMRQTGEVLMALEGIPTGILSKHPELALVTEALDAYYHGRPVTTRCAECGEPFTVTEVEETGEVWVRCGTKTLYSARRALMPMTADRAAQTTSTYDVKQAPSHT